MTIEEFKKIPPMEYFQHLAEQLSIKRIYPSRLNDLLTTKRSVAIFRRKRMNKLRMNKLNIKPMQELHELIIKWAQEKGILVHSNPQRQLLKTHEEIGELLKAIQDNDLEEIKDAIGDIIVTLIIYCKLANTSFRFREFEANTMPVSVNVYILLKEFANLYSENIFCLTTINKKLTSIAHRYELTLHECLESAYNVIKNRTGKMINGTFVKD